MDMGTLRITQAELARDIHAVLAKVQQGVEVIVEQDHRPVAVIRTPLPMRRLLSESIALAEARGTDAIPDEGFAKDVEEGITERSQPWNPPPPTEVGATAAGIIERNAQPVAVQRAAVPGRRRLSEISASLSQESTAVIDPDFAADVRSIVDRHREPLTPPESAPE